MAPTEGEVRGHRRLSDQLLVPRPVTQVILLVMGLAMGELAWRFLSAELLAYVGGTLAPFCLLCAGSVWSMRDKLDAAFDGEHMDAETFARATAHASKERQRFMWRAARVAMCALIAAGPAIAHQLANGVWHWMSLAAGAAVADASFSYLLANRWEEEVRAFKAKRIVKAKHAEERALLEARLSQSSSRAPGAGGAWKHGDGGAWSPR